MKVLLVGGGGREHALALAIAKSPRLTKLWCAPGNAGIAEVAELVPVKAEDISGLLRFAVEHAVDLVVVGPEGPLVAGLVDRLAEKGIAAFGPTEAAAQLEGSKGFMKDFAARHGIPTAAYGRFTNAAAARDFAATRPLPVVIKADGLAAGKGVVIATTRDEANRAIDAAMLDRAFGNAGAELVIEDFLDGEEISFFALSDGTRVVPFGAAQDHKRVFDGDKGPNTGGMGAYSPAPIWTPAMEEQTMRTIVEPTIAGMAKEGAPFRGVLFVGLMLTDNGPELIEFNVRFGDPECQVLFARYDGDALALLDDCARGKLNPFAGGMRDVAALCVVMAAENYPGDPRTGTEIRGLDRASNIVGASVLHAGTKRDGTRILSAGGRVLGVLGVGATVKDAQRIAYQAVDAIDWPEGFCRRDIGWRAL
ncbi:phosphoribosylamine--glycine ligase [Roseiterribacter gracilis]|uniref:Phosphoribosylamine--glycine ligase n=1 Tax=Roseiterribacter gracilis TaxID=2812848 RepID=A0A8S8XIC5_9PROT|nr:phosphoribosylamine--glycine ligase [Rhodospirillales bacterium TMPK1]